MFSSLHSSALFAQNRPSVSPKIYSAGDFMPLDLPSGSELQMAFGGSFSRSLYSPFRSINDTINNQHFPIISEPQTASTDDLIMTEEKIVAPTCAASTQQALCMISESCSQNSQVVYQAGGVDQVPHAALHMGPSQNKPSLSTGRLPTAEQWRSYRDAFTQLYMAQNKTLKEVIQIMKDQYHFSATARMYKQRIKEWKLDKNSKSIGPRRVKQQAKSITGPRDRNDEQRHHKFQELDLPSRNLIEDLSKRYSLSSVPAKPMMTPLQDRYTEILFRQTNVYCESLVEGQDLSEEGDKSVLPGRFCLQIDAALDSLERGEQKTGFQLLNGASELVRPLFASKNKHTLRFLLRHAQRWYKAATPELFKVLWTHISEMASTYLVPNSPTALVCVSITQLVSRYDIYETAFGIMLSKFEICLGPNHENTLNAKEMYQSLLLESGNLTTAEFVQRQLLEHHESCNKYSLDSMWAIYGLGLVMERKGDFLGAEEAYRNASLRGRICNGDQYPTQDDIHIIQHLVRMLSQRKEYIECEVVLGEALYMCMEDHQHKGADCRLDQILEKLDRVTWKTDKSADAKNLLRLLLALE